MSFEAQVALGVAVDQRAGGHHLGVQPGMARDLAVEDAAVAVGPVQHRGDRQAAAWQRGSVIWHGGLLISTCGKREGDMIRESLGGRAQGLRYEDTETTLKIFPKYI
jgi:hypothetical protein